MKYNRRSQNLVNQLNVQTSTDQNTNNISTLTTCSPCTVKSYTSSLEESDIDDLQDIGKEIYNQDKLSYCPFILSFYIYKDLSFYKNL